MYLWISCFSPTGCKNGNCIVRAAIEDPRRASTLPRGESNFNSSSLDKTLFDKSKHPASPSQVLKATPPLLRQGWMGYACESEQILVFPYQISDTQDPNDVSRLRALLNEIYLHVFFFAALNPIWLIGPVSITCAYHVLLYPTVS